MRGFLWHTTWRVQIADVKRVSREIKILKRVRHDNVIQLFEVIDAPKQVRAADIPPCVAVGRCAHISTAGCAQIFLVMELTDGGEVRSELLGCGV